MAKRKEAIKTVCYGHEDIWTSRKKAMDYFREGIFCSDGSERDRYTRIYFQLQDGLNYCTDEM